MGELIAYEGIHRPSVRELYFTSHLKPRSRLFSSFTYSIYRSGGTNNCVFRSGQIRTLVAMATYSSHRLIMGKDEIDNLSVSLGILFCYRNVY